MEACDALSMGQEAFITLEREKIVQLVRRFGGYTTDAILDPEVRFFTHPRMEGMIGYRLNAGCMIVFGDPICAPKDRAVLSKAFHEYAKQQKREVVYVGASEEFTNWSMNGTCQACVEFGREFIFDPMNDPKKMTGTQASLVRRKVKQAIREGVTVHEYVTDDAKLRQAIEEVGVLWLLKRRGLQLHISNVYLFEDCVGKRWFYVKRGEQVIGVICLNRLEAHQGWLLNHLMLTPGSPNGTSELLITSVFEALAKEGCHYVTVGAVPARTLGEMRGFSPFSVWLGKTIFRCARKCVFLDGLELFWGKFLPVKNEPIYVLFSRKSIGLKECISLKKALSGSL